MFLVRFPDADWFSYVLFMTIHILHNCHFIVGFQHSIYTVSLFTIQVAWYFTKKFAYIGRKVRRLNATFKMRRVNNRELAKLINDYNSVQVEVIKIRKFFRNYVGCNIVANFGFAVFVSSSFLSHRLQVVI